MICVADRVASLLVCLSGVVLVSYELGHFMAARHCGIHVEEFFHRLWPVPVVDP